MHEMSLIIDDPEVDCISFRIYNRPQAMSLTEWSVRMGLFSPDDALEGAWFGRHIGLTTAHPQFDPQSAWESIAVPNAPEFKPSTSLGQYIADPALRLAQVFLGNANHHLNICHILGAYIKKNIKMMIIRGCEPEMYPLPEPFNIKFLGRVKILKQEGQYLRFYNEEHARKQRAPAAIQERHPPAAAQGRRPGSTRAPERRQEDARVQARRPEQRERASVPARQQTRQPEQQLTLAVASTEEGSSTQPGQRWRHRVEQLLTEIAQSSAAQAASIARAVEVMEAMLEAVRPQNPARQ